MSKRDWGNATWALIHTLAAKTRPGSQEEIRAAFDIIATAATHLPCPECTSHARAAIAELAARHPPRSPHDIQTLFWHMHNMANHRLNKEHFPWTSMGVYWRQSTAGVLAEYYASTARARAAMRGAPALHSGTWRNTPADQLLASRLSAGAYLYLR